MDDGRKVEKSLEDSHRGSCFRLLQLNEETLKFEHENNMNRCRDVWTECDSPASSKLWNIFSISK